MRTNLEGGLPVTNYMNQANENRLLFTSVDTLNNETKLPFPAYQLLAKGRLYLYGIIKVPFLETFMLYLDS